MPTLHNTLATFALMSAVAAASAAAKERPIHLVIAPGKVAEVCMPLAEGDTLRWRFKANVALDFNLHHHVDKAVLMPVDRKAIKAGSGQQAIDQRNDWCLMWTAPSQPKRITVDGAWSVVPAPPTSPAR
ncbi:MAG: hypothetical protein V4792_00100 [Pseudomonadota bacterium]